MAEEEKFTGTFKSNVELFQKYHVKVEMEDGTITGATLHRINFASGLPEKLPIVPTDKDLTRLTEMLPKIPPVNQVGQELTQKQISEVLSLLKAQIPAEQKNKEAAKN